MNDIKVIKVKKLFLKKNFEEAIILIENSFSDIEKTSEILNILGVCKLQKENSSNFDLLSAIENFRDCYLKEKNTNQGIEGLLNFIVTSNKGSVDPVMWGMSQCTQLMWILDQGCQQIEVCGYTWS